MKEAAKSDSYQFVLSVVSLLYFLKDMIEFFGLSVMYPRVKCNSLHGKWCLMLEITMNLNHLPFMPINEYLLKLPYKYPFELRKIIQQPEQEYQYKASSF